MSNRALWLSTCIGKRTYKNIRLLFRDAFDKGFSEGKVFITTDGYRPYGWVLKRLYGLGCLYGQVAKKWKKNRVTKVSRKIVIGERWQIKDALECSEDSEKLNTSFIERLNLTIRRAGVKVIDLVAGEEVAVSSDGQVTQFLAALDPGGGKIFVIVDRMPAAVRLDVAEQMERGATTVFDVRILDASGALVAGVVPFEIRIEDPAFRAAEPSGFYAAVGGTARVTFDLAENERTGLWRITVVERMRGTSVTKYVPVR